MLTEADYYEIKKLLSPNKKVAILTHYSPDADAIGSSLGLQLVLEKIGCEARVIVPNEYPEFLKWMKGTDAIINFRESRELAQQRIEEAEIVFCLDFNSLDRIKELGKEVEKTKGVLIMIDHHPQPDNFVKYMLSKVTASSTSELIYEFVSELGLIEMIDVRVGECLYAGIMTDTGSFKFPSTSAKTHRVVAELMEAGLKPYLVHGEVFDNNTENKLKLLGYCLEKKMKVMPQFKTAYISLSKKELNRFKYQTGDTEGVVNYALSVKGIVMAVLIKENDECIRMSFRSKGDFSVNDFARKHFSGGGHKNAAGGNSELSLRQTVEKLEALLPDYISKLNEV